MFGMFRNNYKSYERDNIIQRIIIFLVIFLTLIMYGSLFVYAEEFKRSSSLNIKITINGDTERIDYIDEDGNITFAADKHYASIVKTKSENTLLEKFFDAAGKPAVQSLGHYAVLHEYNDEGQDYKITYLGTDGSPVIISLGYSIVIRTYNSNGYIESEMYYDTEKKPVETDKLAYGCFREYNNNGRNYRITYLNQNREPTMCGQGFSIINRTFYEEDELAGRVKEEYYFDTKGTPMSLSLGQYGILKEYDILGRETVITYLNAYGTPIITNEGYTVVKRTYYEDDSIKTEMYYDIEGNPVALSEGQYGYRIEDGGKIYIDSEGNAVFNLRNYLYSHQRSVIIICVIVVLLATFLGKKINVFLLFFYILFIFYMTLLYRNVGVIHYNFKPLWSYLQFLDNKELRWEIINNILLFIPLGTIFSQILLPRRVLLFTIILSFFIELIQLFTGIGLCEIDDLISNSVGGLIGLVLGIFINNVKDEKYSKKQ